MNWKQPKVYAVKHKDEATRAASRSGGIFTAPSNQVLSIGGVIYGCVLTDDFNAVHIRAENEEDRNRMRGSKYIQSKLGDTFKSVKEDLCRYCLSRSTEQKSVGRISTLARAEKSF